MSAYICDDAHICALACYAVEHGLWKRPAHELDERPDQELLAELLYRENVRSVAARYGESPNPFEPLEFEFHFAWTAGTPPVQVIKAAHCYEYQSCEHEGWHESDARRVAHRIRDHAIHRLPGYDEAEWGWQSARG